MCGAAGHQGRNSPDGPSLNSTFYIFQGGYCLVPAATVFIFFFLLLKFSFVKKNGDNS